MDQYKTHSNRSFDKESYLQNDARAKSAWINYLDKKGFDIVSDKEDFMFDLVTTKENEKYLFELEVKNQWSKEWPEDWQEIRIPERKSRLIDAWIKLYDHSKLFFIILNTDLSKAWSIDAMTVKNSNVGKIKNSKKKEGLHLQEPFFHVPKENATKIRLEV